MAVMYKLRREGGVIRLSNGGVILPRSREWFAEYMPYFRSGGQTADMDPLPEPPPKILEEEKSKKKLQVDHFAIGLRAKVVSNISPSEMVTWTRKEDLARKAKATSNVTDAGTLALEAQVRDISVTALVDKVIAKADLFWQLEAAIAGVSGKHNDIIDTLQTVEEVETYDFSTGWPNL